ncbi:hypothetical protein HYX03_02280 [Candidatus Woesearchaeota archaeon]|nr:hypothetical protein [Candidatus Woesearchaeota archaeon]
MVKIYSEKEYKILLSYYIISPFIIFGALFAISPWFLLMYWIPVGLIISSLIAIAAITLQDMKNVRFGYLTFIPLVSGLYLWKLWFIRVIDSIVKEGSSSDILLGLVMLFIGLLFLFPYFYVASTLFNFSSPRRTKTAFSCVAILLALGISYAFYQTTIATKEQNWKTLTNADCGYEIKYSPRLSSYGGNFGGNRCGYWIFALKLGDQKNELKIDNIGNNEYGTANYEQTTEEVSRDASSYIVKISNGRKHALITCRYTNTDMLEFCDKMIKTFKFI